MSKGITRCSSWGVGIQFIPWWWRVRRGRIYRGLLLVLWVGVPGLLLTPPIASAKPLVVMLDSAPSDIHPLRASDAYSVRIAYQLIYQTMVRLDENLQISPSVFASWSSQDGKNWNFKLRKGIRFHDGKPLQVQDVVTTLKSFMEPSNRAVAGARLREKISSLRAIGNDTVNIRLDKVYPDFLHDLILPVLPRHIPLDKLGQSLVGSGPFRWVSQSPNQIKLLPFPDFIDGTPQLDSLTLTVVKDESTRFLKLRKGDVDLAINVLPLARLDRLSKGKLARDYQVYESAGLSYQYLGLNTSDAILSNPKVRLALSYAIPIDDLIKHLLKGHAVAAAGLLPLGSPYQDPNARRPTYDLKLARQLLDEAGYPKRGKKRFKLLYKTSTDRTAIRQARIIQQSLSKVGVLVEVRSLEWATFFSDVKKGQFQMFSLRWVGASEPGFLYELFHSSKIPPNGLNRVTYRNPAIDRLLERARIEARPQKRRALYQELQRRLLVEMPYIPLWHRSNTAVLKRGLEGYRGHPSGGFEFLYQLHWAKK